MPIAFWRESYTTGYSQIDEQHQHLFKIINTLHDAMLTRHSPDVLIPTLEELVHYTQEHFKTEEKIMLSTHYPNYQQHKIKHQELTHKVVELVNKSKQDSSFLSIELSRFLTEWLVHHIQEDDLKMIKFLKTL